ncbi:MAG: gfo/Idh/MocA family oxidoreductase, partial [Opitutaceae bacterium]
MKTPRRLLTLLLTVLHAPALRAAESRVGLIGLDTSHVIAFTKTLNDPAAKDHVPGAGSLRV